MGVSDFGQDKRACLGSVFGEGCAVERWKAQIESCGECLLIADFKSGSECLSYVCGRREQFL